MAVAAQIERPRRYQVLEYRNSGTTVSLPRPLPTHHNGHMTAAHDSKPNFKRQSTAERPTRRLHASYDGPKIVLALGGGFARGFAHLGILEILEQEQIAISAIVGTSIGGLLGAAYGDGISLGDLCDLGRRVPLRDFLRFHRPEPGQGVRGKDRIGQFVQDWFRAGRLEDLPIPTAIVTTDLGTGAPYVFTRGPIEVALRATCAFPGLCKPVEYDGRLLADGCIVAPVPSAIAAALYGGCVLGVSVGSHTASVPSSQEGRNTFDSAFHASRRKALEPSWSRHADILLEPQVEHIGWNDFTRVDEAFSAGADAMRLALPSLRQLLARQSELPPAPDISLPNEEEVAQ